MEMLKVENLHVFYGAIHAIKGVEFSVDKGEIVTLIGANGAGKTTIMHTVSGLLRPKEGTVTFKGKNITGMEANRIPRLGLAQGSGGAACVCGNDRAGKSGDGGVYPPGSLRNTRRIYPASSSGFRG